MKETIRKKWLAATLVFVLLICIFMMVLVQEESRGGNERPWVIIQEATDDAVNEDFLPKANLSEEELKQYTEKIFLDICRNPEGIDKYDDVFTVESIDRFKKIEWYYDNSEEFYDWANTTISVSTEYLESNGLIAGKVLVNYKDWTPELKEGVEETRSYYGVFFYKKETGIIEMKESLLVLDWDFQSRGAKTQERERSIIAGGVDDVVNEDYLPKPGLSGEELKQYTQKIFLDICRDPNKIDKYSDVFTTEFINLFKETEWKYDNPKEFYDWASASVNNERDGIITGDVSVSSQYAVWELDPEKRGDGKWAYAAHFSYEKETGTIEIREHYLFISYH